MGLSNTKFSEGMNTSQYVDSIKVNKQPFLDIYSATQVPKTVQNFFDTPGQTINLAVFTSDWCGDAMSTTPAILKLADSTDNINLEIFNRDDELELANSFLPENRAGTTPIFVVLDKDMRQISRFIETANSLVPRIDAMDEQISKEVAGEGDNARAAGRGKRTAFRVSHAGEWSNIILEEFTNVVSEGLQLPLDQRPTQGGTKWPPEN
ncbi:MAG: hypothetical protein Ct9H300mP27_08490 [Chloroflexota bacterium]|nr:MAG: hypothetical protein Ct9H300mP27_08490 [Chloroflexota bacterium]